MNYLLAENITKYYGELLLYDDISLSIDKGQKVALIAKNGAGKTTLLNILAGKDTPESGDITYHPDIRIGYLEQLPDLDEDNTIIESLFNNEDEVSKILQDYEMAVEQNDANKLNRLVEQMDRLNLWDYETRIKQILTILKVNHYHQKIKTLSGGQKKRVALASFLIKEPDFLIMDEPTNHLDLEMIEWLEEFLNKSGITLLMVTHDRYFLDRVCNEILEMDNKTLYKYQGNYSYYVEKREERMQIQATEVEKAKSLYKKELDWMRRMPQARGTKAKYRIDQFYETEKKASQTTDTNKVQFNVQSERLGKKIMEIKKISKGFDDLNLIENFSYTFARFEKIGIVGKNGTGKSTFLNIITQQLAPDKGEIETGETLKIGYFRQDGLIADENQKVIDLAREIAEVVTLGDGKQLSVSQYLNHFLFPPETQNLFVSKLSGGEKRRLYLMTVLMQNPNFLILDEPTNDLDIMTLNLLEDYLSTFNGCVIVVSHDRYFMDKIVDHLFIFQGEGKIKDFPGNYTQFREWEKEQKKKQAKVERTKKESEHKKHKQKSLDSQPRKISFKEKKELESLENDLSELEEKKSVLEHELNSGQLGHEELQAKSEEISKTIKQIDEKSDRWLELSELNG